MARKLSQMAGELASWSDYYRAKHAAFPERDPTEALLGRAYYLEDVVQRFDQLEQMLLNMPRTS